MTIGTCNGTAGVFSGVAYRPDPPCGAVSYRYYADQATAVQPTDAMSPAASTAGAAAAGMVLATGLKMALKVKLSLTGWLTIGLAILGIVVLRWPLVYVVLALIPTACLLTAWWGKK